MDREGERSGQPPQDALRAAAPARPIDEFCDRVRADPALQEALRQTDDAGRFIALVLETAREHGFTFTADDVRAGMRGRLPGLPLFDEGERETGLPPHSWLPSGTFWHDGHLFVRWSYFGEQRLTEPFFEGDVQRVMRKPFNRLIRYTTPIEKLADVQRRYPGRQPRGFIFHMSRCGSTLVTRMLAALPRNIVISEARAIDAIVRARQIHPDLGEDRHVQWLRWIVATFGLARVGDEFSYFVKLDPLHALDLPLFARAFPDVPWIFLIREPAKVIASQLREPGFQPLAGIDPYLSGLDPSAARERPEEFCAQALARICQTALRQTGTGKSLVLDYRQLPEALWTSVAPHFGIECSTEDREAMARAARFDAKMPRLEFNSSTPQARRQDSAAVLHAAAEKYASEVYRRLSTLREAE